MSRKVATPIIDKNGKATTVHKKIEPSPANNRIPTAAPKLSQGISMSASINETISKLPLKEMDGSLLTVAITNEFPSEDVNDAISLAAFCHRHATRNSRGNLPRDNYINHPLRNTLRLIRFGITDERVIIGSILHDTVEDCAEDIIKVLDSNRYEEGMSQQQYQDVAIELLSDKFGDYVGEILRAVTNKPEVDKSKTKEQKHIDYRAKVLVSIKEEGAFLVKLSDILDNASSLYHHVQNARGMVISLSKKYHPLMDRFIDRVDESSQLSGNMKKAITVQLSETRDNLKAFAELS